VSYLLYSAKLQSNNKKFRFNVQTVMYLEIIIEAGQDVFVDPEKVKVILDWDFKDLCSTIAILSFRGW
jgi:hypothetical protein